jgi:hypothetical protein
VDKAEPENKKLPGNFIERGDDAGLGCNVLLPAAGVHKIPDKIPLFDILSAQASAGNAYGEDFAYRFTESERNKA